MPDRDERAQELFDRMRGEWDADPDALRERAPVMALAFAALVDSEARERELEQRLSQAVGERDLQHQLVVCLEAREAVLVEALKQIRDADYRGNRHPSAGIAERALAGVVEAEPASENVEVDPRRCGHYLGQSGAVGAYCPLPRGHDGEHSTLGEHLRNLAAEPDGSER